VAALVPRGVRVADVGTGDARLPLRLRAGGRAAWCVASERSPQRTAAARRRLPAGGESGVELRTGDGLAPFGAEDRIDVLILAGMGARKMIRILEAGSPARLGLRRLVLQPQCEADRLRRWLAGHGYRIVAERLVVERRRPYVVLAAEAARPGMLPGAARQASGPSTGL